MTLRATFRLIRPTGRLGPIFDELVDSLDQVGINTVQQRVALRRLAAHRKSVAHGT